MSDVYDATKQDFASARAAFDTNDFQHMNVCANRLMANVLFAEEDQKLYAIPGYFLRTVAGEFLAMREGDFAKELRSMAESFIAKLDIAFQRELNLTAVWEGYFEYRERERRVLLTPYERKIYKDNKTFSRKGFAYLTKELFEGDSLFHHQSALLTVIQVEADRLIRNHGAEKKDIALLLIWIALAGLNGYCLVECSSIDKEETAKCLKSKLMPYVDRIRNWYASSEEVPFTDGTSILCDLILAWRRYYVKYGEVGRTSGESERRVELPDEARKRIGETIAQALQKDLLEKHSKAKR